MPTAYLVEQSDGGQPTARVTDVDLSQQVGDVTIDIQYSSLNFKDVLACKGHRGIIGGLPHVPGIDLAGVVASDKSGRYQVGQQVLVTGFDLGQRHWGGWCQQAIVPADWIVPLTQRTVASKLDVAWNCRIYGGPVRVGVTKKWCAGVRW